MRAKDRLGRYGEDVAAQHLVDQGMVLLERNWRCEVGEIDIVARDGDTLVVCEVKTRRGVGYGTPLDAVTEVKLRRLGQLAARWVQASGLHPTSIRIDVVAVLATGRGPASVQHVRGVIW